MLKLENEESNNSGVGRRRRSSRGCIKIIKGCHNQEEACKNIYLLNCILWWDRKVIVHIFDVICISHNLLS